MWRMEERVMTRYSILGVWCVATLLAAAPAAQSDTKKVTGHLVDAVCAGNHATEAGYKEKHENSCNLMPVCVKSGYSLILPDNSVLKFDEKGNEQALAFVKATKKDKDLKVTVTGAVKGQTIAVQSISLD
jgi:hypothetical protein